MLSTDCNVWFVLQGYGDNKPKSSTTAQEVKTLDGIYTEQVNGTKITEFWSAANEGNYQYIIVT